MDLLNDIWETMSQQWIGTVAFLLAVFSLAEKVGGVISAVKQWRVWKAIYSQCKRPLVRYRLHQAKRAMQASLTSNNVRIPVNVYASCLRERPSTERRGELATITPEKPSWLNDHLVATALEALSIEGKVVKATQYDAQSWPARAHSFVFQLPKANKPVLEEAEELETNNLCSIFQGFDLNQCPTGPRYERGGYANTTSPRRTDFVVTTHLIEGAPPCGRCWGLEHRERDIRQLVESITKYDLGNVATKEITGENGEFQIAVINVCTESNCSEEAALVKQIVEQAIRIRRQQLESVDQKRQTEWSKQLAEEFSSRLSAYVTRKSN